VPFNGAGMFVRLRNWVEDATAGIKIRADYHDIEDDNFATGISQCIAKDGQSTVTNNIPMNSKRIVALSDPVDPQDSATKAYADTKLPLTGDSTITGNLTVTGTLGVTGTMGAAGYKTRTGLPGPSGTSFFNFNYTGGVLNAWVDNTNLGALATQAFANTAASNAAAPKVNRSGDTITGGLTVNGELVAVQNYLRFQFSGSSGYIQWQGGSSYNVGGNTLWHTGNLNPIQNAQLVQVGDHSPTIGTAVSEPHSGSVLTGVSGFGTGPLSGAVSGGRWRQLQLLTPGGWYAVSFVG